MMEQIIEKLNLPRSVTIFLFSAVLILPGSLYLYLFNTKLFIELNLVKTLILACAISFPVLILNVQYSTMLLPKNDIEPGENSFHLSMIVNSLVTVFPLYLPLLIKYIFDIDKKWFMIWLSIFEVAYILFAVLAQLGHKLNKNK